MNTRNTKRSENELKTISINSVNNTETNGQNVLVLSSVEEMAEPEKDWCEEKDPNGRRVFLCRKSLCWFRTNTESLIIKHSLKHSKPFMCSFCGCGQRFVETEQLKAHFSDCHIGNNAFLCNFPECGLKFGDINALTEHRISHINKTGIRHKKKNEDNEDIEQEVSETGQTVVKKKKKCEFRNSLIEDKLKTQTIASVRLSDCVRTDDTFPQQIQNIIVVSETQQWSDSNEMTTTITVAESEPVTELNHKSIEYESTDLQKFSKKPVNRVIRCSKVTDEIIEGNNNFIKLRSTEGQIWYKCLWDYCDYGNINEAMIIKHVHKHEFPHKCSFKACNKSFATLSQMAEHRQMTHSGDNPFICDWPQCESAFHSWQLLSDHKRSHLDLCFGFKSDKQKKSRKTVEMKPFQCTFGRCNMHFALEEELEVHQQIHSGDRPFKCLYPECTFAAKTSDKLRTHHSRHSGVRAYKCLWPTCDKSFTISEHLRRHRKLHTDRRDLSCEFVDCEQTFENSLDLEKHLRQHLGLNDNSETTQIGFKCNFGLCKMHFQTKQQLEKHSESHKGIRLFKCGFDDCSYSAKTLDKLTNHLRYHSNERPFKCDFIGCHQEFMQSHHLVRHKRSHFGDQEMQSILKSEDKQFICDQCFQWFTTERSLEIHNLRKHKQKVEEEKESEDMDMSLVCTLPEIDVQDYHVVDKRNKTKRIGNKIKTKVKSRKNCDEETKKGFHCDFGKCNFRALTEEEVIEHKCVHSGDRRFECDDKECNFKTNRKDKLVVHVRRHTGEKPFKCEIMGCEQCFITRDKLNKHILTHNKSKSTLVQLDELDQYIDQTLQELDHLLEDNTNNS